MKVGFFFFQNLQCDHYRRYAYLLYQMVHYHAIINSHSVVINTELFAIQIEASCLKTAKKSFGIQFAIYVISCLDQQTKETED